MCSRRLKLLLSALLLASSAYCSLYSDPKSDPGTMETQAILTELIENNRRKAEILSEREKELTQREQRLTEREADFQKRQESWNEINNFSQNLRKEIQQNNKAEYWRGFKDGFTVGGSAGLLAGGYAGIKIGVRL